MELFVLLISTAIETLQKLGEGLACKGACVRACLSNANAQSQRNRDAQSHVSFSASTVVSKAADRTSPRMSGIRGVGRLD